MKKRMSFGYVFKCASILILTITSSPFVRSQHVSALEQATGIELENIDEGARTQENINKLEDERAQMLAEYRAALKQFDNLKAHNEHIRTLINSQEEERQSLHSQIGRITTLERDVVPLMRSMLDTLAHFIEADTPFLLEQRRRRIARLNELFNDANISKAEKYRRILEAYQIENDYGRHIESYEGTLNGSEQAQIVNFLKVGRVSFMYQTMDGQRSYVWDKVSGSWQPLDDSYNTQLKIAMRMARDQIPPNLLFIPVNAAVTPTL